ncbi:MAG: PIN domain-containing protein [Chlorobium sp.]|nr:MAG: PIN domain-containing protein [Chlorobium sp.]
MAINFLIRAEVVDLRSDTPKSEDVFLVDTNVWYWMTYSRASFGAHPPAYYQTSHYPGYTNAVLGAGAKIFQSGLTLAELAHLIEKVEREIYEAAHGSIKPKDYRHNLSVERIRVNAEIQAAYGLVRTLADLLVVSIDNVTVTTALHRLQTEQVDGYDLFILESMRSHGVTQVITDDGDYTTVSGIRVFTANQNVIQAARTQGRLVTR